MEILKNLTPNSFVLAEISALKLAIESMKLVKSYGYVAVTNFDGPRFRGQK